MRRLLFASFMALSAFGVIACTANRSERSEIDRAVKSMDQGNYPQAKEEIQAQLNNHPGDPKLMVLLAEADLGLAGIQLLDFLQTVSEGQAVSTDLDLLTMPPCDSGKLEKLKEADIRCIMLRVIQHLPDPDDPNFSEARDLLEKAYPDAKVAPLEVNFLSSIVDLGSALGRAKILLQKTAWFRDNQVKTMDRENFHFAVHHLKNELQELTDGFKRARYSYAKISHFVVSMDGKPVIKIGNKELASMGEDIDLPTILRFAKDVVVSYRDNIDGQLNISLSESLSKMAPATMAVFGQRLDPDFLPGVFYDNMLSPSVAFEQAINDIFDEAQDTNSRCMNSSCSAWPGNIRRHSCSISKGGLASWSEEYRSSRITLLGYPDAVAGAQENHGRLGNLDPSEHER